MGDTDVAPRRRRITVWAVLMMLGVSLVDLGVFIMGFMMWLPSMMVVAANQAGGMTAALMYWLMAGPVFASLGFVAGWIGFFVRPRTGLLLGLLIPLAWVISVIAIFVQAEGRCGGEFWC